MPFIPAERRLPIDPIIKCAEMVCLDRGDLAYFIYRLVLRRKRYEAYSNAKAVLHDVLEVLEDEYLEYERQKKAKNGDIYETANN